MGETALPIPAPACDNPQLPVAPNYLWSFKRLICSFIPRTNSFLETFLRDKGTKKPKSPRYFGGGKGRASKRAQICFCFCFCFQCLMHIASTVYLGRTKLIPCLCNQENSDAQTLLPNLLFRPLPVLIYSQRQSVRMVKELRLLGSQDCYFQEEPSLNQQPAPSQVSKQS